MMQVYLRRVTPSEHASRWLLLIHQLPKDPAYVRVKIGRRLARLGAIALKNSVYVLPKTDSTSEDFEWVRQEIVQVSGDATVVEAQLVAGVTDTEIEGKFREAKDVEYAELARELRALQAEAIGRRKRALTEEERLRLQSEVAKHENKLKDLRTTDFFGASGCQAVEGLLHELRAKAAPPEVAPKAQPAQLPARGRTWVTRAGVHVDRIASAWLIRRFIDPEARFKLVPPKGYVPQPEELRFDMFEAEYSHEGELCTFEVLCLRFELDVPGLRAIAELVHDIDIKDAKHRRAEVAGLAAVIAGLALLHRDDEVRLARGAELFEALLTYFARKRT
jgi:hypothetical protein